MILLKVALGLPGREPTGSLSVVVDPSWGLLWGGACCSPVAQDGEVQRTGIRLGERRPFGGFSSFFAQ